MLAPLTPRSAAALRRDRGSRVAGLATPLARMVLSGLAALLLLVSATVGETSTPAGQSAATIHTGLIEAVLSGGDYYLAAVEALRAADRPASTFSVRLPTLTVVATIVPLRLLTVMLVLLALVTVAIWYRRLAPVGTALAKRLAALSLLVAGVAGVLRPEAALVQESWAGLFVALSLGVRRPGRIVEPAALGLAAALTDQTAGLYLLVMVTFAGVERRRNELLGWAVALLGLIVVLGFHAHAVMRAGGHDLPDGQAATAGIVAAIRSVAGASLLGHIPMAAAAPLVALALAGWTSRRSGTAMRVGVVLVGFVLVAALVPPADAGEAALLVAPLSLVGLIFAALAIRDLAAAALDRRRITVRRIVR